MGLAFEAGEVFEVELGRHRLQFRHLSARQARTWRAQLEAYIADSAKSDEEKAADAAKLCQPMLASDGDLLDLLPEALLVLLPLALEKARRLGETELGESCWQHIYAPARAASSVQTSAGTNPATPSR